jgi:hypothetical protein
MLLKSNFRYENTVLMLRSRDYVTFEEAVLQLKQAEERIATLDEAVALMNAALVAHGTSNPFGENSKKDAGKPRGKPTGGDRECWHCGSQDHIRTSCSDWLETPEGTKWAAKNPSKASKVPKEKEKEKEKAQLFLAGLDLGPKSSTWLVDSGATSHMSWDASLFTNIQKLDPTFTVTIADGSEVTVHGIGDVLLHAKTPGSKLPGLIKVLGVYYMPGLNINLLSVSKLEDHNIFIRGRPGGIDLVLNRETISTATRTGGSYALDLYKEIAYASQKASRKAPKTRKS